MNELSSRENIEIGFVLPLCHVHRIRTAVGRESCFLCGGQQLHVPPAFVVPRTPHHLRARDDKNNKMGVPGALEFWEKDNIPLENRGDSRFVCTTEPRRELAVVQFRDFKDVLCVSNVHIFKKDLEDLLYRYVQSGTFQFLPVHTKPIPPVAVRSQVRIGTPWG